MHNSGVPYDSKLYNISYIRAYRCYVNGNAGCHVVTARFGLINPSELLPPLIGISKQVICCSADSGYSDCSGCSGCSADSCSDCSYSDCSADSDCSAFQSPFSAVKNFAKPYVGGIRYAKETSSISEQLNYQPHTIARLPKTAILFRELQLKYA